MAKKITVKQMLPVSVLADKSNKLREITDINEILELMSNRTIVSRDRFILEPGTYEFEKAEACEWKVDGRLALMVAVTFKGGAVTTIGSLRKIDASMKNHGPAVLPVTEAEILEKIMAEGLTVNSIVEGFSSKFDDDRKRIVDLNDASGTGYATNRAKFMAWEFGGAPATPATPAATGKKK
jgi:hypothetical protein